MALSDYAIIPYIANPQTGERPSGWLRSDYYSLEAYFCTTTDTFVKCAYRKSSDGTRALLCAGAFRRSASGIQLRNYNNWSDVTNWTIWNPSSSHPDIYFENYLSYADTPMANRNLDIPLYDTAEEILTAFDDGIWDLQPATFPITYRPTNCSFPGAPTEAAVGDTVTVPVAFEEGYGIVNPSDIYVTCNGVAVPSTYNNGTLTFTMPDPS